MKNKRQKKTRLRGQKTCFWGSRKKHRGKGHRGGVGMSGTGKRSDQKKTLIITDPKYFGKHGFTSLKQSRKKKLIGINLADIEKKLKVLGKKTDAGIEVNLKKYKVLSKGELKTRILINAGAFSKKAEEKIKKSGSVIVD